MDVDNGQADAPSNGGVELEQSLLQQFSCLGTTDKEDLVKQLQKLLGSQLNETTASFFLDMNNWNLQAAICSYFDIEAPYKLPSMALVSDPTANENESLEPNVRFNKSWHVCNNGTERWPVGCVLQFSSGENLSSQTRVPVPCLAPGEGTHITIEMVSPAPPGMYQSKWRLCTVNGAYFGDPLWAIITVVEEGTIELTQQMSHLSDLGSPLASTIIPLNPFGQPRQLDNQNPDQDSPMC